MSNLTGKFNALQAFLTALFEPVITPLAAINTKMDALADINRKLGIVGVEDIGIYERLVNIEGWLNQIKTEASASTLHLNNIRTRVGTMDIRDALRYTLEQQVAVAIGASSGSGLAPITTTQRNIAELLAILNANLGGTTSTVPGTVIALLRNLPDILACVCGGNAPNLDGENGCATPYTSSSAGVGAQPGDAPPPPVFARFTDALPTGITYGTDEPLAASQSELNVAYAAGWRYYVQSDSPSHRTSTESGLLRANNEWRVMDGPLTSIVWIVDQPYTLKVYICPPATALPTICSDFTANLDIRGFWGYRIAGYPGNWSVQANDNWYAENDLGITLGGPYSANQVYSISGLPALPFRMRFGTTVNLTAPTGQICPPA